MKLSRFAFLIPAYNEERNIEKVVKYSKRFSKNIIVIDDGSKDRTAEIAKKSGAIVLRHNMNKGKGEALKTGFKYLLNKNFDSIAIIDADMQYSPKEALKLIKELNGADFVMGYRNFSNVPFRHRLGNFVWTTTFNILFGTKLKETNCGLFAIKRSTLKKININKIYGGYIIENSLLAEMVKKKLRVKQLLVNVEYKKISGVLRGIRIEAGVLIFILREGLAYRLSK